ncbi:MAG: hypothetical protein NTW31_02825 [Bacteroidetes bacterium]|nr:hypothetical protein [Bacteroidota bacterium]
MRSLVILALSFVLAHPLIMAQKSNEGKDEETARIEITARSDQESYRAIACGGNGALIFFKSVEIADNQRVKWYFSFYDRNLKQIWVKTLPVLNDLDFRFKTFSGDTLFIVFVYKGKIKSEDQPLEIVRIDLKTGNFIPNITKVPANSEPVFFNTLGRYAFLALNHKTGQAAVEILDLKSNHSKGFMIDRETPSAFRWFGTDSATGNLKAVVSKAISKKETGHWYQVYDTTGKVLNSVNISTINGDREFSGFKAIANQKGEELVIGTYRLYTGGSGQKNKSQDESTGVFTSLLEQGNQKNLNFINFLQLKSINSLLSTKDLIDLKNKALKKKKNITEYSVDFNVLQDEPFEQDGRIIQVSEVYFPQYHVENFTDFDFYGRPYTNSYSTFDGYRFTGAIITAYDASGMLLWDNALEISELISPELNTKVVVRVMGDKLLLAYCAAGRIGSKIIHNDETTGKLEFSPLESRYPDDKLVSETKSGLQGWYDDFFLCYGFQEIKNVALESNNKRFVFYLTKVKFEE